MRNRSLLFNGSKTGVIVNSRQGNLTSIIKKTLSMQLGARHATGSSQNIMNISEHEIFFNSVRICLGDFSNATLCTLFIHIC